MENKENPDFPTGKDYFSVVTDIGNAAMMRAVSEGKKVEIKEFAVGDGGGSSYKPETNMTALKNEVWRGQINYCRISEESENVLIINAIISGEVGGFTIREMAVFDTENRMIAVCNTPETPKVRIVDGVVNEMNLLMEIVLVNDASVELKVDKNIVTATKQEIEDLRKEIYIKFQNIHELTIDFEEAAERSNINSGEKLGAIFGKIKKIITDLKNVAFTGSFNDLKDKPQLENLLGTVPINKGGTGATTAANARTNLGLGAAATAGLANNCVTTAVNFALDARQGKALQDSINQVNVNLNNKANSNHNHNDLYYNKGEVNTFLANKSDTWHNHDSIGAGTDWVAAVDGAFRATIATGSGALDLGTPDYKWRHAYFKGSVNSEQNCNITGRFISAGTYNNTTSGSANLNIASNGYIARSSSSSKRYKRNIKNVESTDINPLKLLDVPVRQFKYNEGYITDRPNDNTDYIGFIVEELLEHYPQAVEYQDGKPEMWNYKILIPAMLWLIQDLYKKNNE